MSDQNKLLPYLPVELKLKIFSMVEDIDIRRYFRVYGKINKNKYNFLDEIIRYPISKSNNYGRFYLKNKYDPLLRKKFFYPNDYIDIYIDINDYRVRYILNMARLQKKKTPELYSHSKKWIFGINNSHGITHSSINDKYKIEFLTYEYNLY